MPFRACDPTEESDRQLRMICHLGQEAIDKEFGRKKKLSHKTKKSEGSL